MPTYDFKCPQCGHTIEQFLRRPDAEPEEKWCPQCGERLERQIGTGCGVIMKGPKIPAPEVHHD